MLVEQCKVGQWFEVDGMATMRGVVLSQHNGMRTCVRMNGDVCNVSSRMIVMPIASPRATTTQTATEVEVLAHAKNGRKKPTRAKLFGHSVTAVLRAIGARAAWWKTWGDHAYDRAALVVHDMIRESGKSISDVTVRLQLNAGRNGKRGAPANISDADWREIMRIAN